jgi:hypothetical protein
MIRTALIIITIFCLKIYGQNYFRLNSAVDTVIVELNGKDYQIGETATKLKTNFPSFDTVRFKNYNGKAPILCNFKPDSSYTLFSACCASVDIIPTWKTQIDSIKYWDYEYEFDKIQKITMDRPFFTLKIINGTNRDSIYAWYEDAACFPSFKLIDKKGWKYGVPGKCFYWTNISSFVFFKSKMDYSKDKDKYGVVNDVFPDNTEELGRIVIRLFDNQRFIIMYDVKLKTVTLKYE